ncbi:hypothetical protein HZB88_05585, partial [archaeon]|nr:hypothetical protein [archaeon]
VLSVGVPAEADINGDEISDLKLTLNSITAGKADISVEKLETWKAAEEEYQAAIEEVSYAWIWYIVIAVIVLGIVVWIVARKKGSSKSNPPKKFFKS